jgi:hypothetical protein
MARAPGRSTGKEIAGDKFTTFFSLQIADEHGIMFSRAASGGFMLCGANLLFVREPDLIGEQNASNLLMKDEIRWTN